jgi:predicted alpha/beta-fold hydrolase
MARERWDLPDGDFLDLDLAPEPAPGAPLALVLHGLEGSSRRSYVRSACRELWARGVRPIAMNFRGCGGEMNRRARLYHSGETADPAWVLGALRRRFPGRRIGGLGFSLGGNVLLKLLGERADGGHGLLDAAVAMSVPMDLAAGSAVLEETPMGRAYTRYFLRSLKRKVRAKRALLEAVLDVDATLASRTLREFDDAATSWLHGFEGASDYYRRCSSAAFLPGIRVPTLVLHSLDDPFLPRARIPQDAFAANPSIALSLHERGGHVGFLEGPPWAPRFWGDEEGARFLAETLGAPGAEAAGS